MQELSGTPNLARLLHRYKEMGGVMEYVLLERGEERPQDTEAHRQAALITLEVLGTRIDEYFERSLEDDRYKTSSRKDFFGCIFSSHHQRCSQYDMNHLIV